VPNAGDIIVPGDVTVRLATVPITADSATWTTTEVQIASITANLILGRLYRVEYFGFINSTVAGDVAFAHLREDTAAGNQLTAADISIPTTAGSGFPAWMVVEYTAVVAGAKTFVVTGTRTSGTGTMKAAAGTSRQSFLTLTQINN
jgi:hypothetical protein